MVLGRVRREVWAWLCLVWSERVGSFDEPVCAWVDCCVNSRWM